MSFFQQNTLQFFWAREPFSISSLFNFYMGGCLGKKVFLVRRIWIKEGRNFRETNRKGVKCQGWYFDIRNWIVLGDQRKDNPAKSNPKTRERKICSCKSKLDTLGVKHHIPCMAESSLQFLAAVVNPFCERYKPFRDEVNAFSFRYVFRWLPVWRKRSFWIVLFECLKSLGTGVPVLDILSVTPAGSVLPLCNWLDFPLSVATLLNEYAIVSFYK